MLIHQHTLSNIVHLNFKLTYRFYLIEETHTVLLTSVKQFIGDEMKKIIYRKQHFKNIYLINFLDFEK